MKFIAMLGAAWIFVFSSNLSAYQKETESARAQKLFGTEEVLNISLNGDIRRLMRDRGDDPDYHELELRVGPEYEDESLNVRVRVRGNFRRLRKNCDTPPLKFNFKKHEPADTSVFAGHKELKLVVPCQGEEYVIREYLTYKLYQLFTDQSFRVRLVQIAFNDTKRDRLTEAQYGFLIEDKDLLASRLNATLMEPKNVRPEMVEPEAFFRMSVFAYMIGNTDWSVQYLHNMELLFLNDEKIYVTVPYDFDLVGLVSSPYAEPAEALKLRSVQDRLYRGYCLEDLSVLEPTFEQFQELKPAVFRTVTQNELLEPDFIGFAEDYLNDFYATISDENEKQRAFSYPCDANGTGNVVISGMQNE